MENIITVFVFMFGAIIGSFLNVCIVRMPREKSIIFPSSHCIKCKNPISWYDNIPLVSYILLRGKCRSCSERISFRYFIVELLSASLFALLYVYFGLTAQFFAYALFVSFLIIASFIDIEHKIIPDEISVGGLLLGFLLSGFIPQLHSTNNSLLALWKSLQGIVIGIGTLGFIAVLGDFLIFNVWAQLSKVFLKKDLSVKDEFGQDEEPSSMGGGDLKLLAMIGAFMGWQQSLFILWVSFILGAVSGIVIKLKTGKSLIAFGPYIALSAIICLLWGDAIAYYSGISSLPELFSAIMSY